MQKENDNMVLVLNMQLEKLGQMENGKSNMSNEDGVNERMEELMKELVRTKQLNAKLRLELDVLAEKVNENEKLKVAEE